MILRRWMIRSLLLLSTGVLLCSAMPAADKRQDQERQKHYGLIFGTAYGPDDLPVYGARVVIHPAGQKHPNWELISDHRGEFAQRVPPGPGDYLVSGRVESLNSQTHKKEWLKGEAKVHFENDERQDVGLHLTR